LASFRVTGLTTSNLSALSPDCRRLAYAGKQGLLVWDLAGGKRLLTVPGFPHPAHALAFNADGRLLAVGGEGLSVWDVEAGKLRYSAQGHRGRVMGLAFSGDGKYLASTAQDQVVKLYEPDTGKELRTFGGPNAKLLGWVFAD